MDTPSSLPWCDFGYSLLAHHGVTFENLAQCKSPLKGEGKLQYLVRFLYCWVTWFGVDLTREVRYLKQEYRLYDIVVPKATVKKSQ